MLALASDVAHIHEPMNPVNRLSWLGMPPRRWFLHIDDDNADQYLPAFQRMMALRPPVGTHLRTVRSARNLAANVRELGRALRWRAAHARPMVKDPIAFFSAEWLARTFDMHVVMLVRHPAAFTGSLKRNGWQFDFTNFTAQPRLVATYLPTFEDEYAAAAKRRPDLVDQAVLLWRCINSVVVSLSQQHPDWLVVRYEDLAADPVAGNEIAVSTPQVFRGRPGPRRSVGVAVLSAEPMLRWPSDAPATFAATPPRRCGRGSIDSRPRRWRGSAPVRLTWPLGCIPSRTGHDQASWSMIGDTSATAVSADDRTNDHVKSARWALPAVLLALAVLSVVLGFHRLNRRGIGHDEAVSFELATDGWSEMWDVVTEREVNGVLHTLLLRGWTVIGDNLVFLRTLSMLAATGAVVMTFLVGRSLLSTRAGLIASLLLAFHPLLGQHAQSVRTYALATLLAVVATGTLAAAVQRPSAGRWATYSVTAALLVYAHLFGLFVLAGHGLALALAGCRLVGVEAGPGCGRYRPVAHPRVGVSARGRPQPDRLDRPTRPAGLRAVGRGARCQLADPRRGTCGGGNPRPPQRRSRRPARGTAAGVGVDARAVRRSCSDRDTRGHLRRQAHRRTVLPGHCPSWSGTNRRCRTGPSSKSERGLVCVTIALLLSAVSLHRQAQRGQTQSRGGRSLATSWALPNQAMG